MKSLFKQIFTVTLIMLSCAACGESAFLNPFPENAEDYGMKVINFRNGGAEQYTLLLDFTYTLDPQAGLLDKLVLLNEPEISLRAEDGSLDQNKLVEFTPYQLANSNWDVFAENESVHCYIFDAVSSKVRCLIIMNTPPDSNTSVPFGILATAKVKLNAAIRIGEQDIPAGTALPFHVATPVLDYSKAILFDNAPEAAGGASPAEGGAAEGANPANVAPPAGGAAEGAGAPPRMVDAGTAAENTEPREVTINGEKMLCTGSGATFSCTKVQSGGDSGGCTLQPNTRGRDIVSLICFLIFSLNFVIARRKA